MCIRVREDPTAELRPWDPHTLTITIPAGLSRRSSTTAVRAVLAELGIPQPADAAICFCGAPIELRPLPKQRTSEQEASLAS